MRRHLALLCSIALTCIAAPAAAGAPTVESRDLGSSGARLLMVRTPGVPIVSVMASLAGGVIDEPAARDGLTGLLLRASRRGTAKYSRTQVNDLLDRTGAHISADIGVDSAGLGLSCVKDHLPDLLPLLIDSLLAPLLETEPLELERRRMLDESKRALDSPDGALERIAEAVAFASHPYGRRPGGLPETLDKITVEELRAHHQKLVRGNRLTLVAVGDLDLDQIAARLTELLGALPAGDSPAPIAPAFEPDKPAARVESHPEYRTDYLLAYFALPGPGQPGYEATRLGLRILSEDLWERVRSEKGLVYAVSCGAAAARANFGFYASSTDPKAVILETHAAIDKLIAEPPDAKRLKDTMAGYATEYYSSRRRNAAIAGAVAHAARTYGDPARAFDLVERMRKVTPAEIKAALQQGFKNLQWGAAGNAERIPSDLLEKR